MAGTRLLLRRVLLVLAVVAWAFPNCSPQPEDNTPPVDKLLKYSVARVELPSCEIPLPPVRDSKVCPASEIGATIKSEYVCQMLMGLKAWLDAAPVEPRYVQPGDWARIRSVSVCRVSVYMPPPSSDKIVGGGTKEFYVLLEADVPERPRLFYAQM